MFTLKLRRFWQGKGETMGPVSKVKGTTHQDEFTRITSGYIRNVTSHIMDTIIKTIVVVIWGDLPRIKK